MTEISVASVVLLCATMVLVFFSRHNANVDNSTQHRYAVVSAATQKPKLTHRFESKRTIARNYARLWTRKIYIYCFGVEPKTTRNCLKHFERMRYLASHIAYDFHTLAFPIANCMQCIMKYSNRIIMRNCADRIKVSYVTAFESR